MRKAEPIAGLGGVALIVAACIHWGEDMGAVQAVVLIAFGLLFLAVPVTSVATSGPAKAVAAAVLASAFGWIPLLITLLQLLFGDGGWVSPLAALVGWAAPGSPCVTSPRPGRSHRTSPGAPSRMWPRALAALGGIALLVSLAFPWYDSTDGELSVLGSEGAAPQVSWTPGVSPEAWSAFTATDAVLAVLAVAAVLLAFVRPSFAPFAGVAALALVAFRLLWPPGEAVDYTLAPAAAIALAGAVALCAGPVPRLRAAEPLAGLGGLVLLLSLWLPWYELDLDAEAFLDDLREPGAIIAVLVGEEDGTVASAWELLTVIDIALVPLALLALAVPLTALLARGPAKPVAAAVLASAFGWIAVLLVGARVLFTPGALELDTGALIGLGAALAAWIGAWLSLRDESTPGAVAPQLLRRAVPDVA